MLNKHKCLFVSIIFLLPFYIHFYDSAAIYCRWNFYEW